MSKEIDDILIQFNNKVTLSEFIGKYIEVIPRGNNFIARCPFHNEKTPSFSINNEKGLFHCFGCGAGGNIFTFLSKYKNLSFYESLKYVADYLGLELKNNLTKSYGKNEKKILEILNQVSIFFSKKLLVNNKVLDYLKNRSINQDLIKKFNIGYCDSNDEQLKKFLLNMNFDPEQIKSSGLFIKSNRDKNYFGRFRDRVLFPIYNFSENIIGFGGRTFVNSKIKYINSPESIFFKKSENLFGFKQNVESIKNLKEIIIVEGYLDVISLNSKKIFNSVATLGTSLSENQILRAWNYSDNPILCFDGDEAGVNAMEKVAFKILNFLKPGKSVRFLELPEEMDPDNFINLKGKEQFIELKNKSKTLSNFIWQIILKQCGADTPENIALMDEKIIKISNQIKHKNLSLEYLRFLRNKKNEFFGNKRITSSRGFLKKNKNFTKKISNELILISFLIHFSECIDDFLEEISSIKFCNEEYNEKRKKIIENFIQNKIKPNSDNSVDLSKLFSEEFYNDTKSIRNNHFNFITKDKRKSFLKSLITGLRLPFLLKERDEIKKKILSSDKDRQTILIKNYEKISKEINFIKKKEI